MRPLEKRVSLNPALSNRAAQLLNRVLTFRDTGYASGGLLSDFLPQLQSTNYYKTTYTTQLPYAVAIASSKSLQSRRWDRKVIANSFNS
jgi:hypothetical protein